MRWIFASFVFLALLFLQTAPPNQGHTTTRSKTYFSEATIGPLRQQRPTPYLNADHRSTALRERNLVTAALDKSPPPMKVVYVNYPLDPDQPPFFETTHGAFVAALISISSTAGVPELFDRLN